MLTRKAVVELPWSKRRVQRRTNGMRTVAVFLRSGGISPNPRRSRQHQPIVPGTPRDPLAIEELQERDHEPPGEPSQVLELPDIEPRAGRPAPPDLPLELVEAL